MLASPVKSVELLLEAFLSQGTTAHDTLCNMTRLTSLLQLPASFQHTPLYNSGVYILHHSNTPPLQGVYILHHSNSPLSTTQVCIFYIIPTHPSLQLRCVYFSSFQLTPLYNSGVYISHHSNTPLSTTQVCIFHIIPTHPALQLRCVYFTSFQLTPLYNSGVYILHHSNSPLSTTQVCIFYIIPTHPSLQLGYV
jgi:hypothetical protein